MAWTYADCVPIASFEILTLIVWLMWFFLYAIPSANQVYVFTPRYEPLSLTAVSLGLFLHSLAAQDFFLFPALAFLAGVLSFSQTFVMWSEYSNASNANNNRFRNITSNPQIGYTQSLYDTQIVLSALSFFAVAWMMGFWVYLFGKNRFTNEEWEYNESDPYIRAWKSFANKKGLLKGSWFVSDGYWHEFRKNLTSTSWPQWLLYVVNILCVVGVMACVLIQYYLFWSADAGQQYLGPIPNSQFGAIFGVSYLVRPIGPQPFDPKRKKFYGRPVQWFVGLVALAFGVGVSIANVVARQQYTANQANAIPSIANKFDCYLSQPCYQIIASSTTFYEFYRSVAYINLYANTPSSWSWYSLLAVNTEISIFAFSLISWFVYLAWTVLEVTR